MQSHNLSPYLKFIFLTILSTFAFGCTSQSNKTEHYLQIALKDFKAVPIVAHVQIKKTTKAFDIPSDNNPASGYITYLINAEVLESFKGNLHVGMPVSYYVTVEKIKGREFRYPKQKIVFIEKAQNKTLYEYENSGVSPSKKTLEVFRKRKQLSQ